VRPISRPGHNRCGNGEAHDGVKAADRTATSPDAADRTAIGRDPNTTGRPAIRHDSNAADLPGISCDPGASPVS
jgi:hypothetical protein